LPTLGTLRCWGHPRSSCPPLLKIFVLILMVVACVIIVFSECFFLSLSLFLRFVYLFERERACAHMLVGGGTQRENPQVDSQLSAQSDVGLGPMIHGIMTGAETKSQCFS